MPGLGFPLSVRIVHLTLLLELPHRRVCPAPATPRQDNQENDASGSLPIICRQLVPNIADTVKAIDSIEVNAKPILKQAMEG